MKLNLLVTISEDRSALYGVRFVSDFFSNKARVGLTLFSTYPRGADVWEEEKSFETLRDQGVRVEANEARFRKAVDEARARLLRSGYHADEIEARLTPRAFSKAMDIIQEGERGLYDAVVLGRRGVAGLEKLVEESVTSNLMTNDTGCPIWVCRQPEPGRKNILLCLDGSEPGYRMADHVGFVLEDEPAHDVTLFTVRRDNGSGHDPAEIFARARKQLEANNFPPGRVTEVVADSSRIGKAILQEAQTGGYAVVATGRTGSGQTLLQRMFLGSVSMDLMRELTGAVLWFTR